MSVIKHVIHCFAQPLTDIFNESFLTGYFPDALKIANICLIYNNGDTFDLNNYRPIFLLPNFFKIIEKIMYKRLFSFLNS